MTIVEFAWLAVGFVLGNLAWALIKHHDDSKPKAVPPLSKVAAAIQHSLQTDSRWKPSGIDQIVNGNAAVTFLGEDGHYMRLVLDGRECSKFNERDGEALWPIVKAIAEEGTVAAFKIVTEVEK